MKISHPNPPYIVPYFPLFYNKKRRFRAKKNVFREPPENIFSYLILTASYVTLPSFTRKRSMV